MKKLLNILAIICLSLGIAYAEDTENASEKTEEISQATETQPSSAFEWFNGVRGYLGFNGGFIGGQLDRETKIIQPNQSYALLKTKLPLQYAFNKIPLHDRSSGQIIGEYTPYQGYNLNVVFGLEAFFLQNYLGLRLEGGIGYFTLSAKHTDLEKKTTNQDLRSNLTASLGLDFIANAYVSEQYSIGCFAGTEVSYSYAFKAIRIASNGKSYNIIDRVRNFESTTDFFARLGITALLYQHHRIEFMTKLPVAYIAFKPPVSQDFEMFEALEKTSINVGYKYIF